MFGGLMQLIAYGAQYIYIGNQYDDQGYYQQRKKKKRIRFFYDKIKNRKKPVKEKQNVQIQPNNKPNEPGYIYESSLPKYKPSLCTDPGNMRKSIFIPKSSPIKRARINFGWKKVNNLNQFILNKKIPLNQSILTKFVNKTNFMKKIVLLEAMGRIANAVRLHGLILKEIDISNPICKNEIKNTECPITLTEITNQYIQCDNCKLCYDYEGTEQWFNFNQYCSYCTQPISKTPQILQYNLIYRYLQTHI